MSKKEHLARSLKVRFNTDKALVRTETLKGQEYIVTPAVILVEGVLRPGNAGGLVELALASEFGKIPHSWNGRPVTISHPKIDGNFVSAGLPDVWESGAVVGMLFNTHMEDNRLKTEIWANKAWMEESGYTNTLQRLSDGETMEVSTGLFADTSEEAGIWNGVRYDGVWYNIVPDHLALLPNEIGACSVEDGCGTARTNERLQTLQTLSAALKVEEHDNSSKGCCMSKNTSDTNTEKNPNVLSRLISFFSSFASDSKRSEGALLVNATELSDDDVRTALVTALDTKFGGYNNVMAVYSDRVVYESYDSNTGRFVLLSRNYNIGEDGVITLADESVIVRPVTDFVPVSVMSEETTTAPDTAVVEEPAAASGEIPEAAETSTTATEVVEPTANTATPEPAPTPTPTPLSIQSMEELLAAAPEHLKALVSESLELRTQERNSLIETILLKPNNTFTHVELSEFNTPQLQKVASLGTSSVAGDTQVDFTGKGGPLVQSREADGGFAVPVPVFSRKTT